MKYLRNQTKSPLTIATGARKRLIQPGDVCFISSDDIDINGYDLAKFTAIDFETYKNVRAGKQVGFGQGADLAVNNDVRSDGEELADGEGAVEDSEVVADGEGAVKDAIVAENTDSEGDEEPANSIEG